jgi:hypothetical protein
MTRLKRVGGSAQAFSWGKPYTVGSVPLTTSRRRIFDADNEEHG